MSTTGRTATADPDDSALAATLRGTDLVHLVSHADGDSLAAAGLLANALAPARPFQISAVRTAAAADRRIAASTATTIAIGVDAENTDATLGADSNALAAYGVATELDDADPVLALAGAIAAGTIPQGDVVAAATDAGVERRPGVAIPTADLADGLAHSTLFHADVSADEQRAGALLAELELPAEMDERAHRRVASAVALSATEPPAPASAVAGLERALRPHVAPDAPLETVEGFADVLDALARSDPGLAASLVLGYADRTAALDAWREYANAVHRAVRRGKRTRKNGLVVIETNGTDPWSTARLIRDFRSTEPTVLAIVDEAIALATTDTDAVTRLQSVDAIDAVCGRSRLASASADVETDALIAGLEGQQ